MSLAAVETKFKLTHGGLVEWCGNQMSLSDFPVIVEWSCFWLATSNLFLCLHFVLSSDLSMWKSASYICSCISNMATIIKSRSTKVQKRNNVSSQQKHATTERKISAHLMVHVLSTISYTRPLSLLHLLEQGFIWAWASLRSWRDLRASDVWQRSHYLCSSWATRKFTSGEATSEISACHISYGFCLPPTFITADYIN